MTTKIHVPASRLRFGHARLEITPPVGIYHRMWGAARHDRSTGVHRPLLADVLAFAPPGSSGPALIRAQLDLVGLTAGQHGDLVQAMARACQVPADRVVLAYSHTHSAGWFAPDRFGLPGGELILPYLAQLGKLLETASLSAVQGMREALFTYARGRCDLAGNRDGYDGAGGGRVCGYHPDAPADDTVWVVRATGEGDEPLATFVNYACHPTTLAWENTRLSPDYPGAMRETVERTTGVPCVFLQGACGDLGPRVGYVGDAAVADRNGAQLAFAALSALTAMDPPGCDFEYRGPVVSGATLGTWGHVPRTGDRVREIGRFEGGWHSADLPLQPQRAPEEIRRELDEWETRQRAADASGDTVAARDYGARAERARRWLNRLKELPRGSVCPVPFSVFRMGDAVWVTTGGEPYNYIQRELRRRFPDRPILFSPLSSGLSVAYLLTADSYGKGLYQEETSSMAAGCLEILTDAVAAKIREVAP